MASMDGAKAPRRPLTAGAKTIKRDDLNSMGQATDVGKAPTSRVYTRDYSKMRDADDATNKDTVSPYLGNPLAW